MVRGLRLSTKIFAAGLFASGLLAAGAAEAASFTVGNATPGTAFFVQGQSFTPSVAGNAGSGAAPASGTVFLNSYTIDYTNPQTGFATLYIYSSLPTLADAATGAGSLASGTYSGGGLYQFNNVALDVNTKYFAVLPGPADIFDGGGDPYIGGIDLFDIPGSDSQLDEGFGTFDIGFRANLTAVPVPAAWLLMASGLALFGSYRRK